MANKELNEKLAKWAGLEQLVEYYKTASIIPNDKYFTGSLDACFKWLVPKVISDITLEVRVVFDCKPHAKEWSCLLTDTFYTEEEELNYLGSGRGKTPAPALCKAIEKLIDREKDAS